MNDVLVRTARRLSRGVVFNCDATRQKSRAKSINGADTPNFLYYLLITYTLYSTLVLVNTSLADRKSNPAFFVGFIFVQNLYIP